MLLRLQKGQTQALRTVSRNQILQLSRRQASKLACYDSLLISEQTETTSDQKRPLSKIEHILELSRTLQNGLEIYDFKIARPLLLIN